VAPSRTLISTAQGTHQQAFGPTEWGLLAFIAGVWGSSFLLIAIELVPLRNYAGDQGS